MIYNDFQGLKISALAMGAMRLPVIDGNDSNIDEKQTFEMAAYAFEHGVNYFDTAWGYHNGNSELVMGRVLKQFPRDKFYLATKFPGYDLSNMGKVKEIFERQLEKCQVDYFDFYLIHNVCEMNIDEYLNPSHGIYDYLLEQKKRGRIKHLGFSDHGGLDVMKRFLDAYGKGMEFCQIQLNYMDWDFQKAKDKLSLLDQWNIPVLVMEPLRGGQLVKLPEEAVRKLKELRPEETAPGWAFRFLQSFPQVVTTLSGMSTLEQVKANIGTFETNAPVNKAEFALLTEIAASIVKNIAVPCTACRYCIKQCPKDLDIPMLLELYNEHSVTGGGFIAPMALMAMDRDKQPDSCIQCGSCEEVCPQKIKIPDALADFNKLLHPNP